MQLCYFYTQTDDIKMCSELTPLMVWKEVVDHICDSSTLKLLPEKSQPALSCGFPLLRCCLWPGAVQNSAGKPAIFEWYPCPADEVIVALSLTGKTRTGSLTLALWADNCSHLDHQWQTETTVTHVIEIITKLFPGSISFMYITLFHILMWHGLVERYNWWSGCFCWPVCDVVLQLSTCPGSLSMLWLHPALSSPGWGCFLFVLPLVLGEFIERWAGTPGPDLLGKTV